MTILRRGDIRMALIDKIRRDKKGRTCIEIPSKYFNIPPQIYRYKFERLVGLADKHNDLEWLAEEVVNHQPKRAGRSVFKHIRDAMLRFQ